MALDHDNPSSPVRRLATRLVVRFPRSPRIRALARWTGLAIGDADPRIAIEVLSGQLSAIDAARVVVAPGSVPPDLLPILVSTSDPRTALYAFRAALSTVRREPYLAKTILLRRVIGGDRGASLALIAEIAPTLNLTEAETILTLALQTALVPIDPYATNSGQIATRAVASILALYPPLVDDVIAAAGDDPVKRALAGDLIVLAVSRGGLLEPMALAHVGRMVAATASELPERLRPADSRYSTSDSLDAPRRGRLARPLDTARRTVRLVLGFGFRVRLACLLAIDIGGVLGLSAVASSLESRGVSLPTIGLVDALAAAGLLVALHVLAVQLAAASLPLGMVSGVAWPARLASAYVLLSAITLSTLAPEVPTRWAVAISVVLLVHVPVVAWDLVSKSDPYRAVDRLSRDRAHDFGAAGVEAARAYRTRQKLRHLLDESTRIRRDTVEPVRRRRLAIRSRRDGYLRVGIADLEELDRTLSESSDSPLRTGTRAPALVLLKNVGDELSEGDLIGVLEVDEPELAREASRLAHRALRSRTLGSVERAKAATGLLGAVLNSQAEVDLRGAEMTSRRIADGARRFLSQAEGRLAVLERPSGYLEMILPFSPESDAVWALEPALRRSEALPGEARSKALRGHVLRLARLSRESAYASSLDILLARLDVMAREAPVDAIHSYASLIAELGGLACEAGRRKSVSPARWALEGQIDRLRAMTPIPRQEQLVRQRFEELLAHAMVADYFLETQVERGCRKLAAIATTATSQRQLILFGLAKVGSAALDLGRFAMASKIALMLRDAGVDWNIVRHVARDEDYRVRMTTLSELAGGIFGGDVGQAVTRYLDWCEALVSPFPAPAATGVTAAATP